MDKMLEKIIAVLLVITLAGANLSILGMYGITYALTDAELSGQTTSTQNSNVEFNAYFEGGGHTKTEDIDNITKLFVNVKVKNAGYLKNAKISLQNANFKIDGDVVNTNIQSIDKENGEIALKQLNNGSDITLEIPISILNGDMVSIDNFEKETKAVFTGTYIDGNGKEKSISKEIVNKLSWTGKEIKTLLSAEVTKFVPYVVNNNYGVMVQIKVNNQVENSKLPIRNTEINVDLNGIGSDIKPTSVNVIANSTKATNGEEDAQSFGLENYKYDITNNAVQINVSNRSDKIMWMKKAQDEYLVNCIYEGKDVYDYANENMSKEGFAVGLNVQSKIEIYNAEGSQNSVSETSLVTEKIGTIADFDISVIESIGKGQIYANYEATNKEETEYWVRYKTIVNSASLTDSIKFTQKIDNFLTDDDQKAPTTVSGINYAYNKTVKVSEEIFNKILGEEGTIEIYNIDNTKLETIDKASAKDSEGNYIVDISGYNSNQLIIVASKPVVEGKLIIDIQKAIKTNVDYSKAQMQTFTKMDVALEGQASISTVNKLKQFLLKETKSIVEISTSKKDLTTVVKNENVEIRATLDTSSINNALYKNPTLKIKLPSYVEMVEIKDYDIVMDNGLKIKGKPEVTTQNGVPVINIELEGTQTEYTIDAEYKGTIIVLNTDITVKTLTPSGENKITMEFTNANSVSTNSKGTVEAELNFVAPAGIVAANGIANYADKKDDLISISDKNETATIDAYSKSRIVTVKGTVINNYTNKIGNVILLGRFPMQGNTKIDTQDNLGSTFSTTLKETIRLSGIDSSKYTVYYSENANATKDLTNSANGWSTTATTASKSYLIVTNGYEMETGEKVEIAYNVEVPENIKHNNNVYQMYKVYYDNISTIGTMAETKTSAIVGMTTGQGPELTAELSPVLPEGVTYVREGQKVKMKVTVKNTGSIAANNVKVKVPVPNFAHSVTPSEITIPKIEIGKTEQVSYDLNIIDNLPTVDFGETMIDATEEQLANIEGKILNKVSITSDEQVNPIYSNSCTIEVKEGRIKIDISTVGDDLPTLVKGDELVYKIRLDSYGNILENTVVTLPLPKGVTYKDITIRKGIGNEESLTTGIEYDNSNNIVKINIGKLQEITILNITMIMGDIDDELKILAKVTADGIEEHYSNVLEYVSEKVNLQLSELSSSNKYVKENENVTYTLEITNKGTRTAYNVNIKDVLPKELKFVKATYNYTGKEMTSTISNNNVLDLVIIQILPGKTIKVNIVANANLLPDKSDKQIQNVVSVSARGFDEVSTNTVTNIIEYNEEAHKDNTDSGNNDNTGNNDVNNSGNNGGSSSGNQTGPTIKTYKITGTAWEDSNKDGKRDSNESLLSNIEVMLLNKEDNKIVKDPDTNEQKRVMTAENGQYEFTNVPQGEYIAIFVYDASRYSLTTYRAKDVDSSLNSDAISINVTIDGRRTIAGTTDVITITNDNARDIDIGMYSAEKFDLQLDKYISKITLTTPTIGTTTYDYDYSKLAKIEVLGSSLGKSSIAIEYKIVITNQGAIPGYAKKIVDYLPEGVGFNTELNKDWYLSDNGNVYNSSLENTVINPGESKELTLVLTKKITEDSLGKPVNNNAEIYESYNEQGLKDIDSTVANKVQNEDDMSEANIVLSIVTGKLIGYTSIALGVIALLGFGIFEIKKRVLNKSKI